MELIKKVHYLFGTKKIPLFVYCGPEPDGILFLNIAKIEFNIIFLASPISAESSMREFLERIGLSDINTISTNSSINSNDKINNKNIKGSTYSSQENSKFRIPRVNSQHTLENKFYPTSSLLSLDENFMPPLAPNKFNHFRGEKQRSSTKLVLI